MEITTASVESGGPPPRDLEATIKVLLAEYGVLAAAISGTWTLGTSRNQLVITALSGMSVALALIANVTGFTGPFFAFALILLPIVTGLGVVTYIRLLESTAETIAYAHGMNRIRHFFVEYAPDAAPYLVLSTHDDLAGFRAAVGFIGGPNPPREVLLGLTHLPGLVVSIVAVSAGLIALVGAGALGYGPSQAAVAGLIVLSLVGLTMARAYFQTVHTTFRSLEVRFPTTSTRK